MKSSVFAYILISSVFFGLDGNIVRVLGVTDGIIAAGLRAFGACLFLFAVRRGVAPRMNLLFWGAVACSSLASILFVMAVVRIPAGLALVLFNIAMLWIALYMWLLGRPVAKVETITAIVVSIGIGFLCIQRIVFDAPLGWIFGILSGASFGGFLFLGDEHLRINKDNRVLKDIFLVGQCVLVVVAVFRMGTVPDGIKLTTVQVVGCIVLGLFYGGSYILLSKAFAIAGADDGQTNTSKGGSQLVSLYIGALEPPLGLLFGVGMLGDRLTPQSVLGFMLIFMAISVRGYIVYRKERTKL